MATNNGGQNVVETNNGFSYVGGNGDDSFSITGDGNVINAGNGMDTASVTGRDNKVYGGNGADNLSASYFNLASLGSGLGFPANNLLDGGHGDDLLSSFGAYGNSVEGIATKMTGGSGNDAFFLRQSSDTLVNNAPFEQTTVIEGSVNFFRTLQHESFAKKFTVLYDIVYSKEAPEMAAETLPRYGIDKDQLSDLDKAKYLLVILEIQRALGETLDDGELKDLLEINKDVHEDWKRVEDRYRTILQGEEV